MSSKYENFTVKLGIKYLWPWTILENGKNAGLLYDLWVYLARSLGFRISEFDLNPGRGRTFRITNHLFFKELRVDALAIPVFLTQSNTIKFSVAFDYTDTILISSLSGRCENTTRVLEEATNHQLCPQVPLTINLATQALVLAISVIIYFTELRTGFLSYYFKIMSSLIRQPVTLEPKRTPGRMALGFLLIFFVPLVTNLLNDTKASLMSCTQNIPDSFEDILKMGALPTIVDNTDEWHSVKVIELTFKGKHSARNRITISDKNIQKSPDSNARLVADLINKTGGLYKNYRLNASEMERILVKEKRTLIHDKTVFFTKMYDECSRRGNRKKSQIRNLKLKFSKTHYFTKSMCLPFSLEFPEELLELINIRILRYKAVGLWLFEFRKMKFAFIKCMGPKAISFGNAKKARRPPTQPLKLVDFARVYDIWVYGIIWSAFTCILEIIVSICLKIVTRMIKLFKKWF